MTETTVIKFIVALFVLIGAFLSLVSALGVIRLPDIYTRNHAASKSTTLGVLMMLLGTLIYFYFIEGHFNSRLILGIVFIFLTAPVGGHLIGRAAYNSGVKLWNKSVSDELERDRQKLRGKDT